MEKLLWIDLEMTGLDVEKEKIIEVAAIVTDRLFNEQETFHAIVKQDQKYIDGMDDWNRTTHGESGLINMIPGGQEQAKVENDLITLVDKYFPKEQAIIAGNSIAQDRLFIRKHLPKLNARLHYRMLDVSSWKLIFQENYNKIYEKKNAHRALDDIRESIGEMNFYLSFIKT